MVSALTQIYNHLMALALPNSCPCCHAALSPHHGGGLCPPCYAKLPWWNMGMILAPQLHRLIDSYAAPCLYELPLRPLLLQFKFSDATHLSAILARLLLPVVPRHLPNSLIIPVPSHAARLRWRTYSHTVLLARQLSQLSGIPQHSVALRRVQGGLPQAELTRAQRLKLSGSSFAANPLIIHGNNIILIDDILTTGTTAKACTLALKRAGAAQVHVRTVAYTRPE